MAAELTAAVRMYRLGELGDCFLLTFTSDEHRSRVLIDCGSFRNSGASKTRLQAVAKDIQTQLNGAPLDVVVGTHQHNDHVSGFVHCEDLFRRIGVEQVWLSWLDDPKDRQARTIGTAHKNLRVALTEAQEHLRATAAGRRGSSSLQVLENMLGFQGVKGGAGAPVLPADAIAILKDIGKQPPRYLRPGNAFDLPALPPNTVRVYVLGPPRDSDLLYRKDPRTGESYDPSLAAATLSATKFLDAVKGQRGKASSQEVQYPFGDLLKFRGHSGSPAPLRKVMSRYHGRDEAWRKIDDDWLSQSESLAIFMDTFTNNSSLVLAFELVASGKVMLFAADAQTGNWLSWPDVKWDRSGTTTDDLLARTVLYKVGHHGSHNATLVAGLEKMTHPDLAALISVDKDDPNITKQGGWKMPARNLMKRLGEKTAHRVLRMDGANAKSFDPKKDPALSAWRKVAVQPSQTALFVELQIKG
jgi:beta-lactamase superfamily II metal-dependent hydrolase